MNDWRCYSWCYLCLTIRQLNWFFKQSAQIFAEICNNKKSAETNVRHTSTFFRVCNWKKYTNTTIFNGASFLYIYDRKCTSFMCVHSICSLKFIALSRPVISLILLCAKIATSTCMVYCTVYLANLTWFKTQLFVLHREEEKARVMTVCNHQTNDYESRRPPAELIQFKLTVGIEGLPGLRKSQCPGLRR
jgi:hypothetical protein